VRRRLGNRIAGLVIPAARLHVRLVPSASRGDLPAFMAWAVLRAYVVAGYRLACVVAGV
jgi:hypothetical protein